MIRALRNAGRQGKICNNLLFSSLKWPLLAALFLSLSACILDDDNDDNNRSSSAGPDENVVVLEAGDDLEERAQLALIEATPGTIIELPAGTFDFNGELSVSVDHITLRGQGAEETVLNFENQSSGGQGISATGDWFTIEDLAVLETPGDGIKIKDSNGVTVRRVKVGWASEGDENNGAYGVYPVRTTNVLIEDSEVFGASDAGVYVGQSRNIVVRRNTVHGNVAGIEIENSTVADVYENDTYDNTGGILVFDLPNLDISGGERTRVYDNTIRHNNTDNFAPEGNIVGTVPAGTGIMVMANDDIEVFNNDITDHKTVAITVVSYFIAQRDISDPTYDPVPEKIYIHDNNYSNNSTDPQALGAQIALLFQLAFSEPEPMPYIYYDSSGVEGDMLPESDRICIQEEEGTLMGSFDAEDALNGEFGDLKETVDPEFFNCSHASLPAVVLDEPGEINNIDPNDESAIAELCVDGEGINAAAYAVNCPNLSDYRLFTDASDPTGDSHGGMKYVLTSPLFSDYTVKYREVFVPEGKTVGYRANSAFDFPVGTIIAKTFSVKSDFRDDNSSEEQIETRLLIHRDDGWVGLPYIWNQAKTEAELSLVGGSQTISWIDSDGESQTTEYEIPNSNECKNCHGEDEPAPIGPKARLLNRDFEYASGSANQIEHWEAMGLLFGAPDVAVIDTIPDWTDTEADLEARAKGYLDINCAHCHNSDGGAANTTGLYLNFGRSATSTRYGHCKTPVAAGNAAGNLDYVIVPGSAEASILSFRMDSNEPAIKMPELGRSVIHTEGVELINQWIDGMAPGPCSE